MVYEALEQRKVKVKVSAYQRELSKAYYEKAIEPELTAIKGRCFHNSKDSSPAKKYGLSCNTKETKVEKVDKKQKILLEENKILNELRDTVITKVYNVINELEQNERL